MAASVYIVMSSIALLLAGADDLHDRYLKNVNSVFAGLHHHSPDARCWPWPRLENNTHVGAFGARARLTQLALAKELAAIVATGIGLVVAAALVVGTGGSWWPIAIMIGLLDLLARCRDRDARDGWTRPDCG
ncbi:MAG: hypothetical protein R2742_00790 [Micropruina glycogenica]